MHTPVRIFLFALLAWAGASSQTSATVLLPADFTTVVTESAVIAHGRVVDITSVLSGARRTIESLVTLQVIDGFKGVSTSEVTFRVPNGQIGRYRRVLIGAPEFAEGDEVIVFLHRGRAPAVPTLFGLSQGVYRVTRTATSATVAPPVMARGLAAERIVRGDPARAPIAVAAFAREVRAVLERRQ